MQDFLKHARARLQPEDVGLVRSARRRATGLRRDEVAELAGVSDTWFRLFELGVARVSLGFLKKVSAVLRLAPQEQRYLYALCCVPVELCDIVEAPEDVIETLIDGSIATSLAVLDDSLRLLARNKLYASLRLLSESKSGEPFDLATWVYTSSSARRLYLDWDRKAETVCGFLRMSAALELPNAVASLQRLRNLPDFKKQWNRFAVIDPRESGLNLAFNHPRAGVISTRTTTLGVQNGRRQLVIQSGADGDSRERLVWLSRSTV